MRGDAGDAPNKDILRARDNRKDNVNCGPGRDRATVDANDDTSGCERVVEA
jgi:hypothetical protein